MGYENYHDESEGSDGYENGVLSPALPHEYESSLTESDPPSNGQTPTSQYNGHTHPSNSPLITTWSAEQCADWMVSLGLEHYADALIDDAIDGDALVYLQHEDLKDLGVASAGHRLTILKSIYNIKLKQNISIEPDHYVPPSADANAPDANATQDDIARIINQIKLRDERLETVERELITLKEDVNRVCEESKRMREEMLPLIRMVKDKNQPLPTPEGVNTHDTLPSPHDPKSSGGLTRKYSTSKRYPPSNSTSKLPSPTINDHGAGLQDSAAVVATVSSLSASMSSNQSPNLSNQPSPTSPPPGSKISASGRSYTRDGPGSSRIPAEDPWTQNPPTGGSDGRGPPTSTSLPSVITRRPPNSGGSNNPSTPVVGNDDISQPTFPSTSSRTGQQQQQQQPQAQTSQPAPSSSSTHDAPSEIMKSFRVSMEEPCYKVLPVALKKYHINDDWRQYSLYIVHGDQERCLGLEERPLILFKQLAAEGKKPMFMLRKHATPTEGFAAQRPSAADGAGQGGPPPGGGAPTGRQDSGSSVGGGGGGGGASLGGFGGLGPGGGGGGGAAGAGGGSQGGGRVQSYASGGSMPLPGGVF